MFTAKLSRRYTALPSAPSPCTPLPTHTAPPLSTSPTRVAHSWVNGPSPTTLQSPQICNLHQDSVLALCILWVWETYVIFTHYYITQSIFTALKIPCAHLCIPLSPSRFVATTDTFTFSIVLPSPECPVVGIIQDAAFSDWLLSLSTFT